VIPDRRWWADPAVRPALLLLFLLLLGDAAFVVLHYLSQIAPWVRFDNPELYSLETDRGYAEFYQYMKELWIGVLFLVLAVRWREVGYVAWALLFFFLLADDALELHERVGGQIAAVMEFEPPFGLRRQDVGELAFVAAIGGAMLGLMSAFYVFGSPDFKKTTRFFFAGICALVSVGVGVDLIHSAVDFEWRLNLLLLTFEDGGELAIISTLCAASYFYTTATPGSVVEKVDGSML